MRTIPFVRWIANAAARLTGPHGAVTQQARKAGCSRQSVYSHAEKVNAAVQAEHGGGPTRAKLIEESALCAAKTPNCGLGCSRPLSFRRPSNRSSP